MKQSISFIASLLMAITILIATPLSGFAANVPASPLNNNIINDVFAEGDSSDDEFNIAGETRSDGHYYWKITSKSIVSHPYGSWRNGPSGKGRSDLSLTNSQGYNYTVSNTISGSYTSIATISSSLGVTIGKSETHSVGYKVTVPKGKRYQIIFRPQFDRYKVVESEFYKIDGYSRKTGKTKTCYVKVFSNWDYDWKQL
ncbi:MAG: hypothetical protein IKE52_02210 [Mogibacterium sp.]|nr:hypothetical protein [Mogibacterium sp.]